MRAALVVIISFLCATASAQTGGTVTGRITDETGGALPGVTVELIGSGQPLEEVTDGEGRYAFTNVAPGTYQLSVRLINFATVNHRDLVIEAGKTVSHDEVLHLSLNAEVVVVGKRTFANLADAEHPAEEPDVVLQPIGADGLSLGRHDGLLSKRARVESRRGSPYASAPRHDEVAGIPDGHARRVTAPARPAAAPLAPRGSARAAPRTRTPRTGSGSACR